MRSLRMSIWLRCIGVVSVLSLGGCGPLTFTVGYQPGQHEIEGTVVERDEKHSRDRVAIIDISGMILNARTTGVLTEFENPVAVLHEKLAIAKRDSEVKAVILRLNTPGGAVTASDAMYRLIQRFREESGKPVVALMMDVAASGGYYVSCSTDHIVAYPTTVTGSIGVIFQTISFKEGLDRIGVHPHAITSGPSKDVGSPLSELTEEDRKILQGMVDDFYGRFVEVVKRARPGIEAEQFAMVTDGRIFSGDRAKQVGLVDETGDLHTAWAKAKALAGVAHADLLLYHRRPRRVASPYAQAAVSGGGASVQNQYILAQVNMGELLSGSPSGFYYLWQPGTP